MRPGKSPLEFSYGGETISGMVETFSHHWTFESENEVFKQLFPHGFSSFMAHSQLPKTKESMARALMAELKKREMVKL